MRLEPEDFARLYRRYAQTLLVFFQRRVKDPEAATDLMADTFTIALDRRAQFRGSGEEALSGWLWSIAQSVLRAHERHGEAMERGARRLGRERRALTDREIERIEELADIDRLRAVVRSHVADLPREQREAVRLRVLEDLPYNEIAERLGVSVQTTRMRVSRALRRLAYDLDRDEGSPRR
ncbi:MAG TPA: sigma-70 family RNA polymerase sigma factor [Solirubrobacteraceae bacterium]|jgi:RNA polymerase sigma-70 factor (ECF subfamily)|nr:sigma-70 family RNA polymerase sigma factor [Solirubrobacteraceae bacterium]